jgi:3-deoxy-manno-octulosonate cytidylyltransferase (CMP-KDO synthetase)
LLSFAAAKVCDLEEFERLEQLRALWIGQRIVVADAVSDPPRGVDTAEDLDVVRAQAERESIEW